MNQTISLTQFVDIVTKAGTPKASKVREILTAQEYSPAFDFYKALREHIISVHQTNKPKKTILNIESITSDGKKIPSMQSYRLLMSHGGQFTFSKGTV